MNKQFPLTNNLFKTTSNPKSKQPKVHENASENDHCGLLRVETYDLASESSKQSANKSFGASHGFSPQYVKNIELQFGEARHIKLPYINKKKKGVVEEEKESYRSVSNDNSSVSSRDPMVLNTA